MIAQVSFAKTTFNDIPFRFEAGTPNVGGAIGLAAAIEYIEHLGLEAIEEHEQTLVNYALERLSSESGLNLLGPQSSQRIPVFAFNLEGLHGSDVGFILNQEGIAVRAGHHCTQPLLQKLNITGSIRASFSIYNTLEEIDALIKGIRKAKDLLI
jgi:cysteine desulfurase/selenocysteine lyase